MISYLRLIRWTNLVIVATTMYLIRYFVIKPLVENFYVSQNSQLLHLSVLKLPMPNGIFAILVLSTVLITAAGYAINDYFDIRTDRINKPKKVVIGKKLSRRSAIVLHTILNILGIFGGAYVSFYVGIKALSLIFILVTGILWFYSTTYKKMLLIGNIIVATLSAIVPLIVVLFEVPLIKQASSDILLKHMANLDLLFIWGMGFSFFAFVATLIREIVKDIEDYDGDKAFGGKTLPIVTGIKISKVIVVSLIGIMIFMLWYVIFAFLNDMLTILYASLLISAPLLFAAYKTIKAQNKENYHFISQLIKFIMFTGILYAVLANHIINHLFM